MWELSSTNITVEQCKLPVGKYVGHNNQKQELAGRQTKEPPK